MLLLYGFAASTYVLYKIVIYRTDIYTFGKTESFLFFSALITGSMAIILSFREMQTDYRTERMVFSLIFLFVSVIVSTRKFLSLKGDKDLVAVVQRSVWAIVVFTILIITLLGQFICSSTDSW